MRTRVPGIMLLALVASMAHADELVATMGSAQDYANGVRVELWSDADAWQSDPSLPEYGHSYRKLRVIGPDGQLLAEQVLPPDRALDFGYRLTLDTHAFTVGVITGAFQFYLVDLTDTASPVVVGPVRPLTWDEIIGVDGRSGQVFDLWVSDDGDRLGGAVVHGGCFVLDISDPRNPKRIDYTENWNLQGTEKPSPCRPANGQ